MKKKKLLVLATTFPRWKGDKQPTFVKDLCKEQLKEFEVHVLVPHYPKAKFKENIDNLYMHRFVYFYPHKNQKLAYGGILPNIKKNPSLITQTPFLFIYMLFNAIRVIKKENIKMIHAHWFFPHGLISALCNKYLKTKSMVTIHAGGITVLNKIPLIKKPISNFILNNNNILISVSNFGKNLLYNMVSPKLKKVVDKKTKIIPMGTYTKTFRSKINKNTLKKRYNLNKKIIILSLGRLAEKKGLKYLIKSLSFLKEKDYYVLIGGDGPLKKELKIMVNKLNLKNKVKFLGYITGRRKIDYLSLSDILIVPSIVTKSGDTEGLPVTIIEGMAAGLPIITTNVGGIKDIIKDNKNGILIKEKNSKGIAEKIIYLRKNKKLMKKLSKNAILTSKKYDWEIIGKKNINLLKNL